MEFYWVTYDGTGYAHIQNKPQDVSMVFFWVAYDGRRRAHIHNKSQDVSLDFNWVAYDGTAWDDRIYYSKLANWRQHAQIPKALDLCMDTPGMRLTTSTSLHHNASTFIKIQTGNLEIFAKTIPCYLKTVLCKLGIYLVMPGTSAERCDVIDLSIVWDQRSKHYNSDPLNTFRLLQLIQLILTKANPSFWKLLLDMVAMFYCIANWAGPIANYPFFKPAIYATRNKLKFSKPLLCEFAMRVFFVVIAIIIGLKCFFFFDNFFKLQEHRFIHDIATHCHNL